MNRPCAICTDLALPPQHAANTISVTSERAWIGGHRMSAPGGDLPVCPQHAVDVYRGRMPGIAMSWRVLAGPTSS